MLRTRAQYTPSVRWEVNHAAYPEHQMESEPCKDAAEGLCLVLMLRGIRKPS